MDVTTKDSLPEYTAEEVARHDSCGQQIKRSVAYSRRPKPRLRSHVLPPAQTSGSRWVFARGRRKGPANEFEAAIHSQDARDKAKEFLVRNSSPTPANSKDCLSHALGQQLHRQTNVLVRNTQSASETRPRRASRAHSRRKSSFEASRRRSRLASRAQAWWCCTDRIRAPARRWPRTCSLRCATWSTWTRSTWW